MSLPTEGQRVFTRQKYKTQLEGRRRRMIKNVKQKEAVSYIYS